MYELLSLPPGPAFAEMTTAQLIEYREWFISVIPRRLSMLEGVVRESLVQWRADRSVDSLRVLGEWFGRNATTAQRSQAEISRAVARAGGFSESVASTRPSDQTMSYAFDIGIYFGECLRALDPLLVWSQQTDGRRTHANFGRVVIMRPGGTLYRRCEPIRLMVVQAFKYVQGDGDISELLKIWRTIVSASDD